MYVLCMWSFALQMLLESWMLYVLISLLSRWCVNTGFLLKVALSLWISQNYSFRDWNQYKRVVSILVGVQLEIPFLTHHLLIQALPPPPFFKTYIEVCSEKWVISPADFYNLIYYRYVCFFQVQIYLYQMRLENAHFLKWVVKK